MIRKLLLVSIMALSFGLVADAQSYSSLWKQVTRAQEADLPLEMTEALTQIEKKASKEKEYGHLLKAHLQKLSVQADVTPDSLLPQLARTQAALSKTEDEALAAVCNATLGNIYRDYWTALDLRRDTAEAISKRYFKQALRSPEILAKTKAKTYEPLAVKGSNSTIFNDDLLHMIALEAEDYDVMVDYYTAAGNRPAACISSFYKVINMRTLDTQELKKSKYLAQIDSLIHEYQDLPEAGELVIEHFNFIDNASDASAKEKIEFIDYALLKWPTWARMAVLKNARERITLPSFSINIPETLTIPNHSIPVYITSLKNLQTITMNVYKVDISGADDYDPNNASDFKTLKLKMSESPVAYDYRTYYGLPEFREIRDTLTIDPLPVGVYVVEFVTDNNDVATERLLLHISDLRVISMDLPDGKMRLAVVNATTGKPVSGAKIRVKFRQWKDRRWQEDDTTLTTEQDGELTFTSTLDPYRYIVTTADDKAFPWQSIRRNRWNTPASGSSRTTYTTKVYTDRSLYRPGNTIQVSALAYTNYSQEDWQVSADTKLHVVLRDAKNNIVGEEDITTDEWGVAVTSFQLPSDASTGSYRLRVSGSNGRSGSASIKVEEYKRPTFDISFDDYNDSYKAGDTIVVKGWAKTYSGVAVQQAKVVYTVSSKYSYWWRASSSASDVLLSEETTTADDGSFLVKVPIEFPKGEKKGNRFARLVVEAIVTAGAGESHSATSSYPLSDRPTAFLLSAFEDKQCREDAQPFKFVYINNAGKDIPAKLTYSIDGEDLISVDANTELTLPLELLSSGAHTLRAVCEEDTLSQQFIVFSLEDTRAPIDTAAWYYSTSGQQRNYKMTEGKAEYVQFGTSLPDQTIFYAITSDSKLLESGQLNISDKLVNREFTYKEEWGNGIAMRFCWVRDGKLYSYSESLSRPSKDCSLQMEWSTFRDRLTAGQQEEWTLTVKNPDGTPASAQVMAVLYDKSLDALRSHRWTLVHNPYYIAPFIYQNAGYNNTSSYIYGEQTFHAIEEPQLDFYHLDIPYIGGAQQEIMLTSSVGPKRMMAKSAGTTAMSANDVASENESASDGVVVESKAPEADDALSDGTSRESVPANGVRENLNETAFFMPQLVTDSQGNTKLKFTLPESLTTWRFMSVAHDKEMNVGQLESEVIAQKQLMIQPNMPRFIREGDKAQLSATITNTSAKAVSGQASIVISDPNSGNTIYKESRPFTAGAEKSTTVSFSLPQDLTADVYVCKVIATAKGLSDGEQHLLPVLSNRVEVTTSRAFTQTSPGEKTIDLEPLYGTNAEDESLRVEYTNNPAWLMLEALPVVATPDVDNAISLVVSLYANQITEKLQRQLPNDSTINKQLPVSASELMSKLRSLQNVNGSFSWFKGMYPSRYVTQAVVRTLVRMMHLGMSVDTNMLSLAKAYLDNEVANYVSKLKEREAKDGVKPVPDNLTIDYLYIQAIYGKELVGAAKRNADYLLPLIKGMSPQLTIFGKANLAIVYSLHPVMKDKAFAAELLESIRQYSVKTDEMGRYFDTPKAASSWSVDLSIPTQTAVIEALQTITPDDKQTIAELQQWLLQEKRSRQWNTPVNSASAIYAFFNGWNLSDGGKSAANAVQPVDQARLYVDGQEIEGGGQEIGKGYITKTLDGRHSSFKAEKTSSNISWGAVYAICSQPTEDVSRDGESMSIKRELLDADGNILTETPAIGQKVIVRLTVTAQRDLSFVEITDNRPACLEPVNQMSRYAGGYFSTPLDSKTVYYFDSFAKGKHVIETEYFVDRAGNYRAGIATARCTYAPEYQAREQSFALEISK